MNSVTLTNFRGIDKLTIPFSKATMLTGPNGVGKSSILEGLYCLFSETRLDVMPLARYGRRIGIANPHSGMTVGIADHYSYNYSIFWDECPKYGNSTCSVSAQFNGLDWEWRYRKIKNLSELSTELAAAANPPGWPVYALTEYALWDWSIKGKNINEEQTRAQALYSAGHGMHIFPAENEARSFCKYIDFATIRAMPAKLTFQVSKRLAEALRLINPHVTDIRFEGADSGLSVILDDEYSTSLDTLGNGAVTLVNVLIVIFEALEAQSRTKPDEPIIVLIDEIGAAMHYTVMLEIWKYLKVLLEKYPNMYFISTSHSNDCIRAFSETFINGEDSNANLINISKDGEKFII